MLVLAPHTDDAELGCGGLIARKLEENVDVYVAAFSTAEESLPDGMPKDTLQKEFYAAMSTLGVPLDRLIVFHFPVRKLSYYRQEVLEQLIILRRDIKPTIVLIPASQDLHQDHQVLHEEGIRAFKQVSVYGYELPWNHLSFTSHAFAPLESRHLDKKWDALQSYQSQLALNRSYFTKEFIYGLAKVRGTQVGSEWAEAFQVLRVKV